MSETQEMTPKYRWQIPEDFENFIDKTVESLPYSLSDSERQMIGGLIAYAFHEGTTRVIDSSEVDQQLIDEGSTDGTSN